MERSHAHGNDTPLKRSSDQSEDLSPPVSRMSLRKKKESRRLTGQAGVIEIKWGHVILKYRWGSFWAELRRSSERGVRASAVLFRWATGGFVTGRHGGLGIAVEVVVGVGVVRFWGGGRVVGGGDGGSVGVCVVGGAHGRKVVGGLVKRL